MVRLINEQNLWVVQHLLLRYMKFQEPHTHIAGINRPNISPAIYVMWHSDQFCVYGLNNISNVNILISNSFDGEIVSYCAQGLGFKTIRGSSGKKGAIESSIQILERLKAGEDVAIMVDGPGGPYHSVKNGAIKLSKMSGIPIIPVCWYSENKTFFKLPTWDKMSFPFGPAYIINIFGDPIYVPADMADEKLSEYKTLIKSTLEDMQKRAPMLYKEAVEKDLWNRRKKH